MNGYLDPTGHLVAVDKHDCRFGVTWQPVCLEDNCGYRGPFVTQALARAIADEHIRKSFGTWRPVK